MAIRSDSGGGKAKVVKKKKPAPAKKAVAKSSSSKASLKKATYQVPKSLLKNTASNRAAGPVREGQKLTAAEKAAYKAGTAKLSAKAKAALKPKPRAKSKSKPASDWEAGMSVRDWARGQDWYKGGK